MALDEVSANGSAERNELARGDNSPSELLAFAIDVTHIAQDGVGDGALIASFAYASSDN